MNIVNKVKSCVCGCVLFFAAQLNASASQASLSAELSSIEGAPFYMVAINVSNDSTEKVELRINESFMEGGIFSPEAILVHEANGTPVIYQGILRHDSVPAAISLNRKASAIFTVDLRTAFTFKNNQDYKVILPNTLYSSDGAAIPLSSNTLVIHSNENTKLPFEVAYGANGKSNLGKGYPTLLHCSKYIGKENYANFQDKIRRSHDIIKAQLNRIMDNYLEGGCQSAPGGYEHDWFELWFADLTPESCDEVKTVVGKLRDEFNSGHYQIACQGGPNEIGSYRGITFPHECTLDIYTGECIVGGASFISNPNPKFTIIWADGAPNFPVEPHETDAGITSFCGHTSDKEPNVFPIFPIRDTIDYHLGIFIQGYAPLMLHEMAHAVNLCGASTTECQTPSPWFNGPFDFPARLIGVYDYSYCYLDDQALAQKLPIRARRNADNYMNFVFAYPEGKDQFPGYLQRYSGE